MNTILGKVNKDNLTDAILYDLRYMFDYQAKPNLTTGEYFGYHLAMDKDSCQEMKTGKAPENALLMFIHPEILHLL